MRTVNLALFALLLPSCPANAANPWPFACSRTGPGVVMRQADLPAGMRDALHAAVPDAMADPGQPWNVADAGIDPNLPFKRMICAYPDGDGFVVEWEYGGIAHGRARSAFRQVGTSYERR